MSCTQPNYYAVIPATVRYDKALTANAKLLYGEITALCNAKGYCWATNGYFAELYEVSKASISNWIGQLVNGGHLKVVLNYKEDTQEIESRHLYLAPIITNNNPDPMKENLHTPMKEIFHTPMKEIFQDNNKEKINNKKETLSKDNAAKTQNPSLLAPPITKAKQKGNDIVTMQLMIQAFTTNETVIEYLNAYFKWRKTVGLTPTQWEIILQDLRSYAKDDAPLAIEKIKGAIAGGYRQIIAPWEQGKEAQKRKAVFDNTQNGTVKEGVANMDDEELEAFKQSLVKDDSGELIKF